MADDVNYRPLERLSNLLGGAVLVLLALVVGVFGVIRFFDSRNRLARVYHATFEPLEIDEE